MTTAMIWRMERRTVVASMDHGGLELQHGRDIESYLGRGDHPVKCIVARV